MWASIRRGQLSCAATTRKTRTQNTHAHTHTHTHTHTPLVEGAKGHAGWVAVVQQAQRGAHARAPQLIQHLAAVSKCGGACEVERVRGESACGEGRRRTDGPGATRDEQSPRGKQDIAIGAHTGPQADAHRGRWPSRHPYLRQTAALTSAESTAPGRCCWFGRTHRTRWQLVAASRSIRADSYAGMSARTVHRSTGGREWRDG
jgi:hypothetical protein